MCRTAEHRAAVAFDHAFHDVGLDDTGPNGIRADTPLAALDVECDQLSLHCWLVPVPQVYWMMAVPSLVLAPVTSAHLPL